MIFRFFCDESHDSTNQKRRPGDPPFEPRSFVVGGMFGDQDSWSKVERSWARKNRTEGIARFHAAHLNAGTWEFDGWSKARRVAYSKEMLRILKRPGKRLHGISIGLFVDEYRKVISPEGQVKLGHPYLVCFKTAMTTLASQMDYGEFHLDDQVAVIIDQSEFESEALRLFYSMKDDPNFKHRHRLASCAAGSAEESIGLQVADFVAYEAFRLMHGKRTQADFDMRPPMRAVLGTIGFLGLAFGTETFTRIKDDVDRRPSVPNGFFIVPPYLDEEEGKKLAKL
ncbi:MAG: DUF3800 domain-containing protein [Silvibacterium sp.]